MCIRIWRRAQAGWPAGFPVVQFPNPPLIVAIAASVAGSRVDGRAHAYVRGLFFVALTVWATEETLRGVNWFRRVLGGAFLIYIVVRLGQALRA